MTARHGGLADGHGSMTTPARLDHSANSTYDSVQSFEVVHAGSFLDPPDGRARSGFYSNPSFQTSATHESSLPNTHPLSVPSCLAHLDTTQWLHGAQDVTPWAPGSRIGPGLTVNPSYLLLDGWPLYPIPELFEDSTPGLLVNDRPSHNVADRGIPEPFPESPRPSLTALTDVTICGRCGKHFTGQYRRGNCARHVRQQHSKLPKGQAQCICRVCNKVYKRQDARRKHEWKHHSLLESKPSQRKPASTRYGSEYSTDDNSLESESHHGASSSSSLSHGRHTQFDTIRIAENLAAPISTPASIKGNLHNSSSDIGTRSNTQHCNGHFSPLLDSPQTSWSGPDHGSCTNQAHNDIDVQSLGTPLECPSWPSTTDHVPAALAPTNPYGAHSFPWLESPNALFNYPDSSPTPQILKGLNQDTGMRVHSDMFEQPTQSISDAEPQTAYEQALLIAS